MGELANEINAWDDAVKARVIELAQDERSARAAREFLSTLGKVAAVAWGDVAVPLLVEAGKAALDRERRRNGGGA